MCINHTCIISRTISRNNTKNKNSYWAVPSCSHAGKRAFKACSGVAAVIANEKVPAAYTGVSCFRKSSSLIEAPLNGRCQEHSSDRRAIYSKFATLTEAPRGQFPAPRCWSHCLGASEAKLCEGWTPHNNHSKKNIGVLMLCHL